MLQVRENHRCDRSSWSDPSDVRKYGTTVYTHPSHEFHALSSSNVPKAARSLCLKIHFLGVLQTNQPGPHLARASRAD